MRDSNLVVVQAFASQAEADLAKAALESAGIDAMIQADRAGGMRDHLAWSGFGFKVLVREEDVAAAREAINPPQRVPKGKLVVAQAYVTQHDAEVTQGALESGGIAAAIEVMPGGDSSAPGDPFFRVMVSEADAAAARTVIDESSQ
jgi:Putative prokaryotic signal transducing protein